VLPLAVAGIWEDYEQDAMVSVDAVGERVLANVGSAE
jgi:hypothetical protein